jgi:hypothetical protein
MKAFFWGSLILFSAQLSWGVVPPETDHPGTITNDTEIVDAVHAKKEAYYVEGSNLVVTKVLPDDTSGLPHQKWEAKLSDGSTIQVVYNSDMGARVPVHVGDSFSVGGQFLWLGKTGLIHWLHDDPKKIRPDGYVYMNGIVYGDTDHEDSTGQ